MAARKKATGKRLARKAPFRPKVKAESFVLYLGTVWSGDAGEEYSASLMRFRGDRNIINHVEQGPPPTSNAVLQVGCWHFPSRDEAERHWLGGVSSASGEQRPHAAALIRWAAAEFKKRGLKW